jgi:hypothetical protein
MQLYSMQQANFQNATFFSKKSKKCYIDDLGMVEHPDVGGLR